MIRMRFVVLVALLLQALVMSVAGDQSLEIESVPAEFTDSLTFAELHQLVWGPKMAVWEDQKFLLDQQSRTVLLNTQVNYDVTFYDINIRVNDTTETLFGSIGIFAQAVEEGVSEVQVDLDYRITVDSVTGPAGALAYSRDGDYLVVTLDNPCQAEEEFEFTVYYERSPDHEWGYWGFLFSDFYGWWNMSTSSEPTLARTWWPCKDRPDDKADSLYIAITVDTLFYVASNGLLDSIVAFGNNAHTFHYSTRYPIASYLFSVSISEFSVWDDEWVYNDDQDTMPIEYAVYPSMYALSLENRDVVPDALTIFSDKFGLYPFVDEKYGHANFDAGAGMEHQTMTSLGADEVCMGTWVVVHELGHQWWGDMITCRSWAHIWLNEGWATYSEAIYYLEKHGWFYYNMYMNEIAYDGGGSIYRTDTTRSTIFHVGLVYDKAAWVVHMLRGVLGEELFSTAVDAYYHSELQYGSATTEDFRDIVESATGIELDWFFEEWIYGTYRPNYEFSYYEEESPSGGWDVYLAVEQIQTTDPQVFTMPVDFYFDYNTEQGDTIVLFVDEREEIFRLHFDQMVWSVKMDPSNWILKYLTTEHWYIRIVTTPGELCDGTRSHDYLDTIETRGAASTAVSITSGTLPDGLTVDDAGVIGGVPTETGLYTFTVRFDDNSSDHWDEAEFAVNIASQYPSGDVDQSERVDVADLVFMVAWMFNEGPPPADVNLADVDGSCRNDIADLVYFVKHQFNGGPAPVMGCVE